MNMQEVKELLETFDASTLREFDLRKGDFEMYFSKNESYGRVPAFSGVASASFANPPAMAPLSEEVPIVESVHSKEPVFSTIEAKGEVVTSPIVGNAYLQPSPDQPAFVKVGDVVKAEDTICIVEAMKMMNEIPAGVDGIITEVLAENEQVVGIGDALVRIKTNG